MAGMSLFFCFLLYDVTSPAQCARRRKERDLCAAQSKIRQRENGKFVYFNDPTQV